MIDPVQAPEGSQKYEGCCMRAGRLVHCLILRDGSWISNQPIKKRGEDGLTVLAVISIFDILKEILHTEGHCVIGHGLCSTFFC